MNAVTSLADLPSPRRLRGRCSTSSGKARCWPCRDGVLPDRQAIGERALCRWRGHAGRDAGGPDRHDDLDRRGPGAAPVTPSVSVAPPARCQGASDARFGPRSNAIASPSKTQPLTGVVLAIWMIGVMALSIRLLGGWVTARRVARRLCAR